MGANARHGPHQEAHQSSTTIPFLTVSRKFLAFTFTVPIKAPRLHSERLRLGLASRLPSVALASESSAPTGAAEALLRSAPRTSEGSMSAGRTSRRIKQSSTEHSFQLRYQ